MKSAELDDSFDYLFKIVLIGDPGVGKTCIVQRFKKGTFVERHGSTIGVDFTMKTLVVDSKKVKVSALLNLRTIELLCVKWIGELEAKTLPVLRLFLYPLATQCKHLSVSSGLPRIRFFRLFCHITEAEYVYSSIWIHNKILLFTWFTIQLLYAKAIFGWTRKANPPHTTDLRLLYG